ncbi:MAG: TlpA family protein disulfide reductase [Sulfuritalea sp.]|nr:TlpA family protein disulfide reductase [Sulfuritalea sp.]
MKRLGLGLTLAGMASLVAIAVYLSGVLDGASNTRPVVTNPGISIFDLELNNLQGQRQSLGQWRGKVLVVNYWATWCHPCREEMPGFSRLQEKYQDKGVQFVGISIDSAAKIIEFKKTTPVVYPLLIGDMDAMESSAKFGNTRLALPFTAVFDQHGKLFSTKLGRLSEPQLEKQLKELITP